ncbi:MAG: hypothetical protein ABSH53_20870 [Holophaga sp.]|jgi:hypothetical protein
MTLRSRFALLSLLLAAPAWTHGNMVGVASALGTDFQVLRGDGSGQLPTASVAEAGRRGEIRLFHGKYLPNQSFQWPGRSAIALGVPQPAPLGTADFHLLAPGGDCLATLEYTVAPGPDGKEQVGRLALRDPGSSPLELVFVRENPRVYLLQAKEIKTGKGSAGSPVLAPSPRALPEPMETSEEEVPKAGLDDPDPVQPAFPSLSISTDAAVVPFSEEAAEAVEIARRRATLVASLYDGSDDEGE